MPLLYKMTAIDKPLAQDGTPKTIYWDSPGTPDYQATLSPVPFFQLDNIQIWRIEGTTGSTVTVTNVDPTANDDLAHGFNEGDLWVNTATNQAFILVDSTDGAAIWFAITLVVTVRNVDPTVNDDVGAGFTVGNLWVNTATNQAFILVDAAVGAAVWTSITAAGSTDHQEFITAEAVVVGDVVLADALNFLPVSDASVKLYLNGALLDQGAGLDYSIAAQAITWLRGTGTAPVLALTDTLSAAYES